ncbi:MAG: class I mannose-6-phosphate isomerase [Clostridia bacterium]|nr:class I mannose-6-phosphate isomerase [Clostridia bacterium]
MIYPIKMTPSYRYGEATPWGGTGLRAFGKEIPDERTGESLEVSVLPGLESRDPDGKTLTSLLADGGTDMRGTGVDETFPLLLKFISAADRLSVQVHPDDTYAGAHEGGKLGKTEAWVILNAEPGAEIVYGVRPGVTKEALRAACAEGGAALQACLNTVRVKPGEVYFIPAGMLHALGGGISVAEIQQSSDVTYRFYDWDRIGKNGKPRELHIEKGLDVVNPELQMKACTGQEKTSANVRDVVYIDNPAFVLEMFELLDADAKAVLAAEPERFRILCALSDGKLCWDGGCMDLKLGDSVFIPAAAPDLYLAGSQCVLYMKPGITA